MIYEPEIKKEIQDKTILVKLKKYLTEKKTLINFGMGFYYFIISLVYQ